MGSNDYRGLLKCIPEHQHSLFMPQVEQFNIEALPMRFGLLGKVHVPQAQGWCWIGPISDNCMISSIRVALSDDFPFYERPEIEYSNLALMSTASAQIVDAIWAQDRHGSGNEDIYVQPSSSPLLEAESEHVTIFTITPRLYESPLAAGTTHVSTCIHFFPGFFEQLEHAYPGELDWLKSAFDKRADVSTSLELRSILRSITPRAANMPAAHMHYKGKVLEAVSALSSHLANAGDDNSNNRDELIDHAKELLANSLDKPPTLDELANACYTSRTTLCNEFKCTCGMSVGAYLNKLRLSRAKILLESTDEPVIAIARKVGYRHASTFTAMFKRACGVSPQAWRAAHR